MAPLALAKYATPILLAVLAFLGVMIYLRLGHLNELAKNNAMNKTGDANAKPLDARIYSIEATVEQTDKNYTLRVRPAGDSQDLYLGVKAGRVIDVFLKGGVFRIAHVTNDGRDNVYSLAESEAASPFAAKPAAALAPSTGFENLYIMS